MSMKSRAAWIISVFLISSGWLGSQTFQAVPKGLDFSWTEYKLANGLQVILIEDGSLPVISVVVAYGAGPIRESPGKTGLAYLMENLMFQGSENVSPMQHISHIQRIGGEFNANTAFDKTFFYQTVPSNQLALVLWLESDRMAHLNITNADVQRIKETIKEDQLQRKILDPYLASILQFDSVIFPDFAYGHPLIGNPEELRNITREDLKAFKTAYYIPNNAVLCVSGNLNLPKTKDLISKYFDSIPKGRDVPPPPVPEQNPRTTHEIIWKDSLAPSSALFYGFPLGALSAGDHATLKIIDTLLLRGRTSRISKRLLKKERIARYLEGGIDERGGLTAFRIFTMSNNPVMSELCRKAIASEINRLILLPISESELLKAKFIFKTAFLDNLETPLAKAVFLSQAYLSGRKLEELPWDLEKALRVTPGAIQHFASRFFKPENAFIMKLETQ